MKGRRHTKKQTMEQALEESHIRSVSLTNENAELRMQLHKLKNEQFDKLKQLTSENKTLRNANARLSEEQCEWKCLTCTNEYYGPASIEKGSFVCIMCKATDKIDRYCVPKKYLPPEEMPVEKVIAQIVKAA